jgi:hypothetical protein
MSAQPIETSLGQEIPDTLARLAQGASNRTGQVPTDTQAVVAGAVNTSLGQMSSDTQRPRAQGASNRIGQADGATRGVTAGAVNTPAGAILRPTPSPSAPLLADPLLYFVAQALDDCESARIATENRLRTLTRVEADEDGEVRGFALPEHHPLVASLAATLDVFAANEKGLTLHLKRQMRTNALHPWVKAQIGLGEKQVARLLSAIGDPYWNTLHDRPRTVSELWAYSGLHVIPGQRATDTHELLAGEQSSNTSRLAPDAHLEGAGVAARRRKGQRANWSSDAKMRAYLCAESCVKQARSPYRAVYLERREHTAVTHPEWTKGHSHNDAMRIASKAILRDLWREAKRLHEQA